MERMENNVKKIMSYLDELSFGLAYRARCSSGKEFLDYRPQFTNNGEYFYNSNKKASLSDILSYMDKIVVFKDGGKAWMPACPVCYRPKDFALLGFDRKSLSDIVSRYQTNILLGKDECFLIFSGNPDEYVIPSELRVVPMDEAVPVQILYEEEIKPLQNFFTKKSYEEESRRLADEAITKKLDKIDEELDKLFSDKEVEEKEEKEEDVQVQKPEHDSEESYEEDALLEAAPSVLRDMLLSKDVLLIIQEIRQANKTGEFMKTEDILEDEDLKKSCLSNMNYKLFRWFCKDGEEFGLIAKYAGDGIIPEPVLPEDQKEAFKKLVSAGADPQDLFTYKENTDGAFDWDGDVKILDAMASNIPDAFGSVEEARKALYVFLGKTVKAAEDAPSEDVPAVDEDSLKDEKSDEKEQKEQIASGDEVIHIDDDFELIDDGNDKTSSEGDQSGTQSQASFLDMPSSSPSSSSSDDSSDSSAKKPRKKRTTKTSKDSAAKAQETRKRNEAAAAKKSEDIKARNNAMSQLAEKAKEQLAKKDVGMLRSKIEGGLFKAKSSTYKAFAEKALLDEGSIFLDATGREDRYKSQSIMLGVDTSKVFYNTFDSFDHLLQVVEAEKDMTVYIYGLTCLDPISKTEALRLRRMGQTNNLRIVIFGRLTENDNTEMFD